MGAGIVTVATWSDPHGPGGSLAVDRAGATPSAGSTHPTASKIPHANVAPPITGATAAHLSPSPSPTPTARRLASTHTTRSTAQTQGSAGATAHPGTSYPQVAPGTYTYDVTGTSSTPFGTQSANGTATMVVDPAGTDGFQHSATSGDQGSSTESTVRFEPAAVRLQRLHLVFPTADETFTFAPTALYAPTPASVGQEWAWHAASDDHSATLDFTGKVTSHGSVTIGGQSVPVAVLESKLHLVGGSYDLTITQTDYYDEQLRLIVKEHQVADGTLSGIKIHSDTTHVVRSLTPA